ncbi:hypothetical protein [Paenibacillus agricola]|uniref:Uncharacterized protein n=1 Tax=Paenibacillus agricola TaxID=2716264 RepID=A0ABX0JEL8_9BACL|nr:hypothetical protein [Paenibacillus agricola]NHN33993.1 hypothetical protein [Paenibacillus agricola]
MAHWISPVHYSKFDDEEQAMAFCKSWGLLPQKATKPKTLRYRAQNMDVACEVIGYADLVFAVIQVGEHLHNIHPSYLREMQTASFGKGKLEEDPDVLESDSSGIATLEAGVVENALEAGTRDAGAAEAEFVNSVEKKPAKSEAKKEAGKPQAPPEPPVELPEGKVSIEATVSEFAMVPNPFSDNDDEVVIFESVSFASNEETFTLDTAWSSYSNALKKIELQIGDKITCEAKLVAKKLSKHPVKYKINNAAKIVKTS